MTVISAAETVQGVGRRGVDLVERVVPAALHLEIGAREPVTRSKLPAGEYVLNEGSAPIAWLSAGTPLSVGPSPSEVSPPPVDAVAVTPPVVVPAAPPQRTIPVLADPEATITESTVASVSDPADVEGGYDFLFGETVVRTVEGAAVREEQVAAKPANWRP
ncbi:MAG: hypothetical protein WDM88_01780 [Galbitalea sp.]